MSECQTQGSELLAEQVTSVQCQVCVVERSARQSRWVQSQLAPWSVLPPADSLPLRKVVIKRSD